MFTGSETVTRDSAALLVGNIYSERGCFFLTAASVTGESPMFVQPRPPQMPSSGKLSWRKQRIRSAGHDRTPPTSANGGPAERTCVIDVSLLTV